MMSEVRLKMLITDSLRVQSHIGSEETWSKQTRPAMIICNGHPRPVMHPAAETRILLHLLIGNRRMPRQTADLTYPSFLEARMSTQAQQDESSRPLEAWLAGRGPLSARELLQVMRQLAALLNS